MHQDPHGDWVLFPVSAKGLHPDERTIADVLKARDYRTACIGKWHLGDQPSFLPTRQGFDSYFGIPYSNDMGASQRSPNPPLPLLRDETVIEAPVDQTTLTRRYTEEAVRFIKDRDERPFFLYLSHTMPHVPIHVHPDFQGRSSSGPYGDAVEEIDWSTGEILRALGEEGLERRTLVVFTSDNGATRRGENGPLSGGKGSTMEGGMRVPCLARWPGRIPAGTGTDAVTSTMDLLPTLAGLAGASLPQDAGLDGHDISGLLFGRNGADSPYEAFFYYFMGQLQAVRSGPWKLHLPLAEKHHGWHREPFKSSAALFHLGWDIGETENVIDRYPEVAARLTGYAEEARTDLGDLRRQGRGQRPAGWIKDPRPLVMTGI
jgi:arylsulfatase A-like enzyme